MNFNKQPDYSKRKMFLDPAGSVTVQRYDDFAYSKMDKFTKTQRGAIWVPDEVTLVLDKIDFTRADEATKFIFTQNVLRQTALDSRQGVMPMMIFTPVASIPETAAWALWWTAIEQIHSESYSHIIRNIYNMPSDQFNAIHETKQILDMISNVDKYYDKLHVINSLMIIDQNAPGLIGDVPSEHERVKAVWLALNASYALEAIRFMVSFSTSLGMTENKIFMGNGNIIALILADELLHADATAWMINVNVKDDERFRAIKEECKEEVYAMYMSVIAEEKAWADHIFQKGTVLGLNASIMKVFVDWTAQHRLKDIGIKYDAGVKSTPLPWFNKHLNTNKKQTALQENESVSYVIGAMTSEINYDELPDL